MGKRIECDVTEIDLHGDARGSVPSLCVECGECGHQVDVFGRKRKSLNRAFLKLKDECPEDANNFYVSDYEPEDGDG